MTTPGELQQKALFYSTCLANHLSNDETAITLTVDQLAHVMLCHIGAETSDPMEMMAQAFGIAEFIALQRDYLYKNRADQLQEHLKVVSEKYDRELRECDFWQNHAQQLTQQVRDLQVKLDREAK